jgi:hypothetical protein
VHVVSEFVAQVVFMDLLSHKSLFTAGYQVRATSTKIHVSVSLYSEILLNID